MSPHHDTICALATAPGIGAVGIIRVSGPQAFAVADSMTRRAKSGTCAAQGGHTLRRARVVDEDAQTIDAVLLAVFHAPRSFTGEDMVEIHGHGGPIPLRRILERLLAAGARPARPGEFTERAFLNGKMDLTQAEAVADIISAQTDEALAQAQRQGEGRLANAVRPVRERALGVLARVEAAIDFPEDVGELDSALCAAELAACVENIDALLATARQGILTRSGLHLVLVGRPNVGKSSLLNALLRQSRSIVSPVPGTTRDVVEETFQLRGIPIRAADTAGLRDTADDVERQGVERSRTALAQADLVVCVLDATAGMTDADRALLSDITDRPHLVVWNKCDLTDAPPPPGTVPLSAATGWNLPVLEDAIADAVGVGNAVPSKGAVITQARHKNALEMARLSLHTARQTLLSGLPIDLVSGDVRAGIDALGEVTGETASADVIGEIFSRFCIGK